MPVSTATSADSTPLTQHQCSAESAARLRLIEACEEVRVAARALGLDADTIGQLYAPLAMRAAWFLARTNRLIASPTSGADRSAMSEQGRAEWIDLMPAIREWAALETAVSSEVAA